jgi:hypothetical protein
MIIKYCCKFCRSYLAFLFYQYYQIKSTKILQDDYREYNSQLNKHLLYSLKIIGMMVNHYIQN